MALVGMHEAKSTLSKLVERAAAGEEIVIARRGEPVARLVPVSATSSLTTVRGSWRGRVRISDSFDELPDDIATALGAR